MDSRWVDDPLVFRQVVIRERVGLCSLRHEAQNTSQTLLERVDQDDNGDQNPET